ncbi:MAG TPA: lysophospholipid acyltransferase family protein [Oscillospiraceae bacterium]|nr:lysophospholipid acyltransferase family protein [Oscillospiraceae bacterium]
MMYTVLRVIVTFIYKIVYNLKIEGKENVPKTGGHIFASNHRSYADPVLISLGVPKRFAYMAKEELFKNPLFSLLIRTMGAFPVTRGKGDTAVIDTAVEKLKSGRNLVIFPEGTRSYDGKVGRGKSGVSLIAAKAGTDVIPVGIIFKGKKLKFRSKLIVRYGKPIKLDETELSATSASELKGLKSRIMGAITELVEGDGN